jgi:hypothetical protein
MTRRQPSWPPLPASALTAPPYSLQQAISKPPITMSPIQHRNATGHDPSNWTFGSRSLRTLWRLPNSKPAPCDSARRLSWSTALEAWNGSWNEQHQIFRAISAPSAVCRVVYAGRGVGACSRASRNAPSADFQLVSSPSFGHASAKICAGPIAMPRPLRRQPDECDPEVHLGLGPDAAALGL